MSVRAAPRHLKISKTYLHKIKANIMGFKTYNIKTAPKYNEDENAGAATNFPKLFEKMLKSTPRIFWSWIMKTTAPLTSKHQSCKVLLIWPEIDKNGSVSNPFASTKNMNFELYLKECVIKRLTPSIKNKHVLFWPNMCKCHNAKIVTEYFRGKKLNSSIRKTASQKYLSGDPLKDFGQKFVIDVGETSGEALMRGARQSILSTVSLAPPGAPAPRATARLSRPSHGPCTLVTITFLSVRLGHMMPGYLLVSLISVGIFGCALVKTVLTKMGGGFRNANLSRSFQEVGILQGMRRIVRMVYMRNVRRLPVIKIPVGLGGMVFMTVNKDINVKLSSLFIDLCVETLL
ncbi:hypothetical protein Fcan01_22797 [Folsomia candida]|uniref:Uncharacterized protein n=1 Tax=Folsomia candida TaxID=158441 RepID=A0A226DAY4_FOLCA|nr:hypothetical protein Fcan01_22797 [Folsomia candida]